MKADKKFTWAQLKKIVNAIPDKHLNKEVVVWKEDDDGGGLITNVEILKEDYLFSGDEGCCPKSQMKDAIKEEKKEFPDTASEYEVVHEKGTRILHLLFNP